MGTSILDPLRQKLAQELGRTVEETQYNLLDMGRCVDLRIPGPGTNKLDFLEDEGTDDIIGRGKTFEEALEDAVSAYKVEQSKMPFVYRHADCELHEQKPH